MWIIRSAKYLLLANPNGNVFSKARTCMVMMPQVRATGKPFLRELGEHVARVRWSCKQRKGVSGQIDDHGLDTHNEY